VHDLITAVAMLRDRMEELINELDRERAGWVGAGPPSPSGDCNMWTCTQMAATSGASSTP
jgi:hypothetical protein